uniref:Uncharacterized protein n=1 Tax=Glossina morsitans morsitans TaxID=37546 RepID=A0A1B0G894_GLOMM
MFGQNFESILNVKMRENISFLTVPPKSLPLMKPSNFSKNQVQISTKKLPLFGKNIIMRKSQLNEAYDDWVGEDVRDQDIESPTASRGLHVRGLNNYK